ncbi:MAG: hypothetical protein P9M11_01690 [Candidatus Tenebribacter burtonii]|jgi:hypothetical protein|nr:hypothetical protein [Candidatus Tenebribacter burtonii]
MIKIHLENEDEICEKHYLSCKDAILGRIEPKLDDSDISDFHNLLNFIKQKLEEILTKKPDGLATIHNDFVRQFGSIVKPKKDNIQTYNLIDEILNYTSFSSKATNSTKWDAYKLAEAVNVSVCPYCNRLYTNTVTKDEKKIVRPDFDHFFPKSLYPLFQMSFYNLIPSCTICNSRLKGNRHVNPNELHNYVHPYLSGFGEDGRFTYKDIAKDKTHAISSKWNLRIEITNKKKQKLDDCKLQIKNNCAMFKIEEIYQMHTDVVADMIDRCHKYNDIYVDFLKSFDSLGLSKSEIYKIAFGNYYNSKDFQKRPLSKLTRDIYDELLG